jgi:ribulose-phosphate 3-epimerase
VNPGFSGQEFIPTMLPKVRRCREMIDAAGHAVRLAVDGGVGVDNVAPLARAGADVFVAGSAVFGDGDPGRGVARLRDVLAATDGS